MFFVNQLLTLKRKMHALSMEDRTQIPFNATFIIFNLLYIWKHNFRTLIHFIYDEKKTLLKIQCTVTNLSQTFFSFTLFGNFGSYFVWLCVEMSDVWMRLREWVRYFFRFNLIFFNWLVWNKILIKAKIMYAIFFFH